MTGQNVRGEKPRPQWQMAAVHHCASRHGCLSSAASTFPSRAISLQRPALAGAARGANEAVRPPAARQILRARFLIGKTRVERLAGHRSVIFPSGWHVQNNTRTFPLCKPCSTTSCAAGSKGISFCTPNADLMREFIEFGAQGKRQALYTPHIAYVLTNPAAFDYVDAEQAKALPTNPAHLPRMVAVDTDFWGANKDTAAERFEAWLLS